MQRSFPLLTGVVLSPLLCKDGVGNFEGVMSGAMVPNGVASAVKLLHYWRLADWAKEGSGHLSTLVEAIFCYLLGSVEPSAARRQMAHRNKALASKSEDASAKSGYACGRRVPLRGACNA